MVKISEIHSLLLNNQTYARLTDQQRVSVLNFASQEFIDDSIACVNNEVVGSYERFTNHDIRTLSLAITEKIDDFLSDDDYLSQFTQSERLLIYNIAQESIAKSLRANNPELYTVNNMKGDYVIFTETFNPELIGGLSVVDFTKILTTFNPLLNPTLTTINPILIYSTFIPVLSLLVELDEKLKAIFIPILNHSLEIAFYHSIANTFIPQLTFALTQSILFTKTFNPLLSYELIIQALYDEEFTYVFIPSLTYSVSIE
jgi:hypothetical protein